MKTSTVLLLLGGTALLLLYSTRVKTAITALIPGASPLSSSTVATPVAGSTTASRTQTTSDLRGVLDGATGLVDSLSSAFS